MFAVRVTRGCRHSAALQALDALGSSPTEKRHISVAKAQQLFVTSDLVHRSSQSAFRPEPCTTYKEEVCSGKSAEFRAARGCAEFRDRV
ncbi:hypothetical protein NDU88_003097 [Pleurodeles waltl]|uniref:Uncharacterized protein n=1 Tax=Pleurodeles waltl TaxID=8319 RepID=A0AAV7TN32_PLEWA|nr:hypothetical protein NDU88_003097 [Pleurodeles waltl]